MLELTLPSNPKKTTYKKISRPVQKISYLFSLHSNHPLYLQHKNNLIGVLNIVKGLEYHIKNLRRYEKAACNWALLHIPLFESCKLICENSKRLHKACTVGYAATPGKESVDLPKISRRTNHQPAVHEAVAYIGRLGQLAAFFESKWFGSVVKENVITGKISSILALQPIRNKHTAHRQQDAPRDDDCSNLGFNQFGLKHGLAGLNTNPEIVHLEYSFPSKQRHRLLDKYHQSPIIGIEHLGQNNNLTIFTPTKNHPTIINETISLLEVFFGYIR